MCLASGCEVGVFQWIVRVPDFDSAILSAGGDQVVRLWDAATGKAIRSFTGHQGAVTAAAFSPDGKRFVSGGTDRLVKVWDVTGGKELFSMEGHKGVITAVAWSPDGKRICSGSADQSTLTANVCR